ncbi:sprouty-related, EVH1 domain-containing protein 1 isoform X2 [Agrilus planipennis]|uniref:Sprouty-related, EVH1 domain-containing protein 1 isoform X2 n=1 Tax=Agrilus planipennis TaxID=224129 RepID=A0A7F5R4L1_AGRPL|nr:sprouty-related, EVH1 domain-containing protein 1 isoform X2 [Agrilus planipennis]
MKIHSGYLVRVRAQVMSRDDSSGGWVPLGGGGLSNVSVRKRPRACPSAAPGQEVAKPKHDYLIYGKRISDQSIVLSCTIKKDFEYNKVMPTFHHWKTGDKKFGLTFQTAADARAFDKGVRTAVEELLDGLADTYPLTNVNNKYEKDVGDDDVFMTLNLPQEPKDSRSSSDSSTKGSDNLHRIHYIGRDKPLESRPPTYDPMKGDKGENYSYVQLTAVHEYTYPVVEDSKPPLVKHDSSSPKKTNLELIAVPQPPLPLKSKFTKSYKAQVRCRHCHELFNEDDNPKGSCEYGPDCIKSTIHTITCIGCAQCVCYHCATDAEAEYVQRPCECTYDDNCGKRWLCLTFLSLFVPCLWFYPPLKLCHWCGVRCGLCGGRHSM